MMTPGELVEFIAETPDILCHTVVREGYDDHDDHYATVMHTQREVAVRIVSALTAAGIEIGE